MALTFLHTYRYLLTGLLMEPPSAALPAPLADPTQGPAAALCRSAGRPPAPAAADSDIRTVLRAVADAVRALAAELQSGRRYYQEKPED